MSFLLRFWRKRYLVEMKRDEHLVLLLVVVVVAVVVFLETVAGQCPTPVVTRNQWEARRPKFTSNFIIYPPTHVIIHHTSGSSCYTPEHCAQRVRQIQNQHMDEDQMEDIAYNFLIGGDGRVYEGRGWTIRGSHSAPFDRKSLGIAYIGNFALWLPTAAARSAGRNMISCAISQGRFPKSIKVGGHRQESGTITLCPGFLLYHLIRGWPNFSNKL